MSSQHSILEEASQAQGIIVPLELEGLRILRQEVQAEGRIRVEVIGTNERAARCLPLCKRRDGSVRTDSACNASASANAPDARLIETVRVSQCPTKIVPMGWILSTIKE